jgi:hypothetical protein
LVRLPLFLTTLAWVGLAACSGEPARPPASAPEPKIVALQELEALVKQARGRGALVNVWATW